MLIANAHQERPHLSSLQNRNRAPQSEELGLMMPLFRVAHQATKIDSILPLVELVVYYSQQSSGRTDQDILERNWTLLQVVSPH
ncbi:hypothetical protein Tco_0497356 [Tanacetum coccineum]